MALAVISGQLSQAQASSVYRVSAKIVSRWVDGSGHKGAVMDRSSSPKPSPANGSGFGGKNRNHRPSSTATDRQAHRHGDWCFPCHRQPCSGTGPVCVRLKDITPAEPVVRYEYAEPGGLIHLDIKRLGRFHRVGHRITGDGAGQSNARGAQLGKSSMYSSTMPPASPLPTSCRMKRPSVPLPS